MDIEITTFGFRHGPAPEGSHIVLDLRQHFRDPHVSKELRYLTAEDEAVRENVLATPGVAQVITATLMMVHAYSEDPKEHPLRIAVGCAGGRHRAATVGMTIERRLRLMGVKATLTHRDLNKEVVSR